MGMRLPAMEWHRGYVTRGTRSCTRIKSPVNASWSNARFHAKMAISSICGALCILHSVSGQGARGNCCKYARYVERCRSEEHTSELQSRLHLVCRLLLEKKKAKNLHDGYA